MNKPSWYAQKVGVDGDIVIAVDQVIGEGMVGYKRYLHPFQVDRDPSVLVNVIEEMSEVMGRVSAQPVTTSRAGAFGLCDEARA